MGKIIFTILHQKKIVFKNLSLNIRGKMIPTQILTISIHIYAKYCQIHQFVTLATDLRKRMSNNPNLDPVNAYANF